MPPKNPSPAPRWLALLCLLPLGCGWCARTPPRSAEEFLDKDTPIIVSVPSLGTFADHIDALKTTARKAGNTTIEWLVSMADRKALGIDLFTREGQKEVGIDPDRSMAAAVLSRHTGYVALPYTDLAMLTSTLKRLAQDRFGAGVSVQRTIGKTEVIVLSKTAGGPTLFAWTSQDRFLLVGLGPQAAEDVVAAAERAPENSAARAGAFPAEKAQAGARDLYVLVTHLPDKLSQAVPEGLLLGVSTGANELSLHVFLPTRGNRMASLVSAIASGPTPLAHLPTDQPAYLRGAFDWTAMARSLDQVPVSSGAMKQIRDLCHANGVDLDADLLGNLEPGFATAINLAPTATLSTALDLNPATQNPFDNYSVILLGRVKDTTRAQAALAKLPQILAGLGATVTTHDLGGTPVYTARYRLGEALSWMLHGNDLIAAGGLADRLDPVLQGLVKGTTPLRRDAFSPRAADILFSETGLALAVDFHRLTENIAKLSSGAPGDFMVRSFIDNVLKSVDQLRPVVAVTPAEGGLTVDVVTNVTLGP